MFFSAREDSSGGYDSNSKGFQFRVGETLDTSTLCFEATKNIKSMWISCGDGIIGSKIFVY
jgi:hypothetical protein